MLAKLRNFRWDDGRIVHLKGSIHSRNPIVSRLVSVLIKKYPMLGEKREDNDGRSIEK